MTVQEQRHLDTIVEAWCDVLGSPPRSDAADFVAEGGDSLLAAQLAKRLSCRLGIHVTAVDVLRHPSPAGIKALVTVRPRSEVTHQAPTPTDKGQSALTFSQERMWFMHALAPQAAAYNIYHCLRLNGRLDSAALRASLGLLIQRHAALRSTFSRSEDNVVTHVSHGLVLDLQEITLKSEPRDMQMERASRALTELTCRPFNLETGPVFRTSLIRLAADDALLVLVAHHCVADQWSLDILVRDLAVFYNQALQGRELYLPDPLLELTEYAAWHREHFHHHCRASDLAYWRQKLNGLTYLSLQEDFPRPPQQGFSGDKVRLDFSPGLVTRLRERAASCGLTVAMLLLSALKILLYRHTGVRDIAVGVPIANRQYGGAEELVGTLVNTLVLRTSLEDDPTLDALMQRVRETALEAYSHQDMPFELLVQDLGLPRDPSRTPLFSVMFNMLNTPLGDVRFDGLTWSRFDLNRKAAQFDLTVTIDTEHDRSIIFEYASEVFEHSTIEQMSMRYHLLLQALPDIGDLPISRISVNTAEEQVSVREWGTGRSVPAGPATVAELLDHAFRRFPESTALRFRSSSITYAQLDAASRAISSQFSAVGLTRGARLGICLPRSTAMLIVQLASLRFGVAYVPLDPAYPPDRLVHMAEDAKLDLLVTTSELASLVEWPTPAILQVDSEGRSVSLQIANRRGMASSPDAPRLPPSSAPVRPQDAAYVIYTSGSTGSPKGVVVPHGAVANFLLSMADEPGLLAGDRLLAITTLNFDIAVLELLLPLHVGATVVLAEQEHIKDGAALIELMLKHEISIMQATPTTWRMLVAAGWRGRPRFRALVGGEPLSPALAQALVARSGETWNMYGPTETTVWSTCWRVPQNLPRYISLGRPIANTQVYVLDADLQPCPIGVPGEIWIGGAGVSSGYLYQPELTAERFLSDPFNQEKDFRIYRTGDRGRWRAEGTLEHMGRLDAQLKLRGHRIEPGEIEVRLMAHPAVAGIVVGASNDAEDETRLVAYIVPWEEMPPAEELREFLRRSLPEYMLPQYFVELDAIPTLPNGKVNFAGLPSATAQIVARTGSISRTGPRTPLEHALAGIWTETLGVSRLGTQDSFFDLGGHSMLAVQLITRIRRDLGYPCSLPMLFRHKTIAELAAALQQAAAAEPDALVALQPRGTQAPVFCLCGLDLYQPLADLLGQERPVYGVFVSAELDFRAEATGSDASPPTIRELADGYLHLIRARQTHGPYHLLGFSLGGAIALELAHQLHAQGETVGLLAILDATVPGSARDSLSFLWLRLRRRLRRLVSAPTSDARSAARGRPAPEPETASRESFTDSEAPFLAALKGHQPQSFGGRAVFVEATMANTHSSYGWRSLVRQLDVYRLPTDHMGLLRPPTVAQLAAILRAELQS